VKERLSVIEKQLRRAVETQRYEEIQRLVLEFCEAAEASARALPAGDPRIGEVAEMTQKVLSWTRTMVQTGRESLVLQLRQMPKVKRYLGGTTHQPAAVHVEA